MAKGRHSNPVYNRVREENSRGEVKARQRAYYEGYWSTASHPLFSTLEDHVFDETTAQPIHRGWAVISDQGVLYRNPRIVGSPDEWAYVVAHCLLHLGLGHFHHRRYPAAWNAACDVIVARFLAQFRLGENPEGLPAPDIGAGQTEETLYERFCLEGVPEHYLGYSVGEKGKPDMVWEEGTRRWHEKPVAWERLFGVGMRHAVAAAVEVASGEREDVRSYRETYKSRGERAREWCTNRFPLLGALASSFKVIEDTGLCRRLEISVAAVSASAKEIYINPAAGLDDEEYRFVMAHELLHVGLRHHIRQEGRDHYLWNVACDYVINAWLIEMGIGDMPQIGALYDPELKDLSAEAIYDRIVGDLRTIRKLSTLRGKGAGDILAPNAEDWWRTCEGMSLDDFYRRCLGQGLVYQENSGRGYLPAGLVEEIRAMSQPPIPWDVALAEWFEAHFAPPEKMRSYARASRRQAATPDIPRPGWMERPGEKEGRTYGVVLDTSGSMDRGLLAKALGAIASYSLAHEVPAARVVFCDAHPYDQGYMPPEDIGGRVKVRGRGGTILQPGIDLLEKAADFPKDGPILIITDTECDHVHVRREHAYLIPVGKKLPFLPRGDVFLVE